LPVCQDGSWREAGGEKRDQVREQGEGGWSSLREVRKGRYILKQLQKHPEHYTYCRQMSDETERGRCTLMEKVHKHGERKRERGSE